MSDDIYTEKGKNMKIANNAQIRRTKYTDGTVEVTDISHRINPYDYVRRINANEFMLVETGEIKEYEKNDTKTEKGIKKSMRNLEQLIRNNFKGNQNELMITLTVKENITDPKILQTYYKKFWKKLKRKYPTIKYIYIIEKHSKSDRLHIHALIKDTESEVLYIPNSVILDYWGYGFTKTTRITNKSYNNSINEELDIECIEHKIKLQEKNIGIDKVMKYMMKTRGKENLPAQARIYSKSKGIAFPETDNVIYEEVVNELLDNDYQLKNERTILVKSMSKNSILNKIKVERWEK